MARAEKKTAHVYKVTFVNQGKVYEVYAKQVHQGSLLGFVEIEELLFGERSQVVVDPTEESLKKEFEGVRRVYLPLHSVVRIDEVEKKGTARISTPSGSGTGNVAAFPVPLYTPSGDSGKKS